MKTLNNKSLILGLIGMGFVAALPSCVDPYVHADTSSSQTVTTYRNGYEVASLPSGYRTEVVGGSNYYIHNGTYYQPRSGRYVVVEAPRPRYSGPSSQGEVVVTTLPSGYRTVNHRNGRYYQVRDTYYQQRGSGYVVVTNPF